MWNYLYFLYSLKKKEPTDYTGIESYVSNQLSTDELGWMPIGRAVSLQVVKALLRNLRKKETESRINWKQSVERWTISRR